ncbi:helix-turn-helix transcriptional regulator [Actinocorallia aurantiaca]|uniref:Helix-turn-helix transcriptional regulator n=1 Tax=Actinocorallia aurantiaca TaxID=46204 RepID=A0ABP6GD22_9ACTN
MTAQSEPSKDPAIRAFAITLGAFRVKAGLGKKELAEKLGYTPAYTSQVEAAKNVPSPRFAEDLNTLFGTEAFTELQQNIMDARTNGLLPPGFIDYVDQESRASLMYIFEFGVIKGIFQTYDYACEVLRSGRAAEEVEQLASKRMERQKILARDEPPQIVAVFDEGVIRRTVGGREIMRDQIARLVEISKMPNVTMHIVPPGKGAYPGVMGAFTILRFDDGPDMVYTEGYLGGSITGNAANVRGHTVHFDLIRGVAMSADDSLEFLHAAWEGL